MIRTLWFLVKLCAALAAVLWLAYHPGWVTVSWLGYHVEISTGLAAAGLLLLLVITAQLYRLWRGFISVPKILRRYNQAKMWETGYRTVTKGLVAVAAGDTDTAWRHARRARKLLPEYALTRLLLAQAAQMRGDRQTARLEFQSLMDDKDAAFFGIRGLLNESMRTGDTGEIAMLMKKAEKLQPRRNWILQTLFESEARTGQWEKAEQTLSKAVRTGAIDRSTGLRHRVALLLCRAETARSKGFAPAALGFAKKAFRLDPGFAPATVLFARLLIQSNKHRLAVRAVEKGWKENPHPELLDVWEDLVPEKNTNTETQALTRFSWFRRLHRLTPENALSAEATGQAALDARLWGDARSWLQTARAYKLLARLEREENNDEKAARRWLDLATEKEESPVWACQSCGHIAPSWTAICAYCDSFDMLEWQMPWLTLHQPARKTMIAGATGPLDPPVQVS